MDDRVTKPRERKVDSYEYRLHEGLSGNPDAFKRPLGSLTVRAGLGLVTVLCRRFDARLHAIMVHV